MEIVVCMCIWACVCTITTGFVLVATSEHRRDERLARIKYDEQLLLAEKGEES